ncbi:hypothetical protein [Chelativorans sp. M5D2P16]|nr:hypothetical protein [Chelativorans sp. M5D2P16]MDZ5698729.1 hypothetical protein [Chelativorans sp. M5D2P16]
MKRGPQGETAYINQFFTMRNREIGTKLVFAGGTRRGPVAGECVRRHRR